MNYEKIMMIDEMLKEFLLENGAEIVSNDRGALNKAGRVLESLLKQRRDE